MKVFFVLLMIGAVLFAYLWWDSMLPARNMSSRIHRGMTPREVMESGSGWVNCTFRTTPAKAGSEAPVRYFDITSPASTYVNTNSSTFPEDKPTRRWVSRRNFSTDLEQRIRSSKSPWQATFVFTGMMNRSDFTVTFSPDGRVSDVGMLHLRLTAPDSDPLANQ